jgi:ubiquinol-cytochrome c reductase cytochrome b subunit
MDKDVAKGWFGAAPPDLTLISRAKKPEYLYTYLRTFYQDDSRPYGVNNLVYPNVGMPHVLLELQGLQECVHAEDSHAGEGHCDSLEVASAGIMMSGEFDDAMYDLVNFLAYTAEPFKQTRIEMGKRVMLFLAILFILAWALNREYWKDVH